MRVAYVFESRFLAGTIYPFVMILASLIKNRTLRKRYLFFSRHKNVWDIGHYLKLHFNKNVHTFKILRQCFPLLQQISLIALSSFISGEFEVNRDLTTRCTKWRTISYLKVYSYPKLYFKKLSNQKPTVTLGDRVHLQNDIRKLFNFVCVFYGLSLSLSLSSKRPYFVPCMRRFIAKGPLIN